MINAPIRHTAIVLMLAATPTFASAAAIQTFGEDLGPGENTRLAATPNADAARAEFLSHVEAGQGESFESLAHGTYAWTQDSGGTWTPGRELAFGDAIGDGSPALTATMTAATGIVFDQPTGTNDYGRYATGGTKFFQSNADPVVFEFSRPIVAFGFDGIDVGDFDGQLTASIYNGDNLLESITIAHAVNGEGGDVLFWGIRGLATAFDRVVLGNTSGNADVFALDRLIAATVITTPVPAGLPLIASALGALAWMRRRRAQRA